MSSSELRSYPRQVVTEAGPIVFRLMGAADEAAVLEFARALPVHDLLFLPRNISEPKVLTAWVREIERGTITSLLAWKGDKVVGCGTIVRDVHSWSPHVGGIRMVISTDVRGAGVGRALTQETFALALSMGLEKLTAQMTVDQTGAIAIFEGLATAAPTTSSCSATTSRRCARSWKPTACRRRFRTEPREHRRPRVVVQKFASLYQPCPPGGLLNLNHARIISWLVSFRIRGSLWRALQNEADFGSGHWLGAISIPIESEWAPDSCFDASS